MPPKNTCISISFDYPHIKCLHVFRKPILQNRIFLSLQNDSEVSSTKRRRRIRSLVRNDPSHSLSLVYPAIDAHNFDEEAGFPFLIGVGGGVGVGVPNLQCSRIHANRRLSAATLHQSTPLKLRSTQPPPLPLPHRMI